MDTRIIDEDVEPVDFNADANLIGISFMTYNAPRVYEIADQFRAMGKLLILVANGSNYQDMGHSKQEKPSNHNCDL